jgi:demethylmenaquinone methyltransferase/2-methoxy-6-polyprenyl-1,4-benzoquinol methylase
MLEIGRGKVQTARLPIDLVEGDALQVPIRDGSVDVVTVAFGLRNLESVERGLKEMHRLLRPGGRAAVLEFSRPQIPIFCQLFQFYFTRILPRIGNVISGSAFAYQYLPDSVKRFPDQKALASMMQSFGFSDVRYYNLFGGVAALHLGDKP